MATIITAMIQLAMCIKGKGRRQRRSLLNRAAALAGDGPLRVQAWEEHPSSRIAGKSLAFSYRGVAADLRQPDVFQRQEAEEGFRDKERVRKRFQGPNFFFLGIAARFFFSFFLFAFRYSFECGFEGPRGPF